jgi:16S rRNA (guanine527-N7)-methyltransferase
MHPARIAELLEPFFAVPPKRRLDNHCHSEERSDEESAVQSDALLQSISTYIDILLRWNARINLTAIRDPEEIVTRHFGESFFAARHLFPREARAGQCETAASASVAITLADVGSGAGFPGIPIKLWAPYISLTLIESNHKKASFLREVTRALRLTDVNIQNIRADDLTGITFDVVTLRAVERFAAILPIAAALVAPGGRLALLVGSSQVDQARLGLPNLSWQKPESIPLSRSRALLVGRRQR